MNNTTSADKICVRDSRGSRVQDSIAIRSRLNSVVRTPFALVCLLAVVAVVGCINGPMNPAATQPATISDPATTQPGYWYAQPSPGTVTYESFSRVFKTSENLMRDFGFKIDRVDYRNGVLTSEPLESAQIFEPWRPDVRTFAAAKESTLASIRRTIRFEFKHTEQDTFEVSPKVLVERQTVQERRITNVALYRGAYQREDPRDAPRGTKETDEGFLRPTHFWYSIGRDAVLETKLARELSKRLAMKEREMPEVRATTEPSR